MPSSSATSGRNAILWFWLATFGRAAGESAVRLFTLRAVVFRPAPNEVSAESAAKLLMLWFILASLPAVVLVPLIGGIASGRYRRIVLLGGTLLGVGIIGFCTFNKGPWVSLAGFLAIESVFFGAIRYAAIAPLARQAQVRVIGVQGLFALATVGGMLLGFEYAYRFDPVIKVPNGSIPDPLRIAFAGYLAAFVALLFLKLPAEGGDYLKEGLFKPLWKAAKDVCTIRELRRATCSLLLVFALFLTGFQIIRFSDEFGYTVALGIGVIAAMWYPHPFRALGMVPFLAMAMFAAFLVGTLTDDWHWTGLLVGGFAGWWAMPVLAQLSVHSEDSRRGRVFAVVFALCGLVALAFCEPLIRFESRPDLGQQWLGWLGVGIAAVAMIHAWACFTRPLVEMGTDILLSAVYNVRWVGEDVLTMPARGPVLVIANHAAWLDPLWLSKVLQRPTTPMMTAGFYDLPVISFLMRRVIGTIRVAEIAIRKEAPEIKEAIAALQKGQCVVIFPEGYLRRKEEQPVRRFGRGVWQMLAACPETPVYACWIEGGWGSYFSHKGGFPTKNKKFDWFRRITIAVRKVPALSAETLASHMATRQGLLKEVVEARSLLGLPEVSLSGAMVVDEKEAGA